MDRQYISWSLDLQQDLAQLSAQQRQAILTIIDDELKGVALLRRLKTPYSCPDCGWFAPRSLGARDDRKAGLYAHQLDDCDPVGPAWYFIANLSTYYGKWSKNEVFTRCLATAREEATVNALSRAVLILSRATPKAALEIVRQIDDGERDHDRRAASFGVLDRADLTTADKAGGDNKVEEWLEALREDSD